MQPPLPAALPSAECYVHLHLSIACRAAAHPTAPATSTCVAAGTALPPRLATSTADFPCNAAGNLVTNATWEHLWLNEGFTRFLERKILGRLQGEQVGGD